MPDFRAPERAFDLLEQVAGRAGRGETPGQVVIQTYLPDDPVIRAVSCHDRSIFIDHDLAQRADAFYPPFIRLTNILVWSSNEVAARQHIETLARTLRKRLARDAKSASLYRSVPPVLAPDPTVAPVVLGPTTCTIERAKDRFRYHLLIKSPLGYDISEAVFETISLIAPRRGVYVSVDIDAYDLM